VRSYDTSLYFDDLEIERDDEAAALIAAEARDGWDLGHRAFKIKVGRGARHMQLEAGMRRDIAIIRAVRDAVGPEATVMIDANNGWNLNLTKRVLFETADAAIYWVEEAFHEDNVLYEDLHAWIAQERLGVRIADGEGVAHPAVLDWARDGLIDVLQYNIFGYGFGRWAAVGAELAAKGVAVSPHTYGGGISPHVSAYLAMLTDAVQFVEWDAAIFPALDTSAYRITDGWVSLPDAPGFGFALDDAAFAAAVRDTGLTLTA
jgi:L-alanine-DL-glutamate epimerase-like enolase superfamily enzyme